MIKGNPRKKFSTVDLPAIPDKLYFTIGEVAQMCAVETHVLRYWEQEFPDITPSKRRGNRRYYKPKDVRLIRKVRELLYDQGFTIEGARRQLSQAEEPVISENVSVSVDTSMAAFVAELEGIVKELETA